jgi:hypothetical protein
MPNLVTKKFKIINARNFIEQFSVSSGNSLYMFLAKANQWAADNDTPLNPEDTQESYNTLWDEIISLKRVSPSGILSVARRINWEANKVYAEYDNEDSNLLEKDFYVLNRDYEVYKCIDNFNGSQSRVEPTGKSLNIFTTSDGYKWKYMYSITTADRLRFLTQYWMPVRLDSSVAAAAKDGAIENIKVFNGGLDYSVRANVIIEGDGEGANIGTRQSLGVIYDFIYNNPGSKYRFANVYVRDYGNSKGRNANIRAILSPVGGHGADPISELGAHYVMINVRTEYNEGAGDFPGGFTYRKLGLVKNPKTFAGQVANVNTLNALRGIELSNINGTFRNSEFIEGVTSKANIFTVVSNVVESNGFVRYVQTNGLTNNFKSFNIGESVIGKTSGATALVSGILVSETTPDTGDIIYVENKSPILRSPDQSESLTLVLEF